MTRSQAQALWQILDHDRSGEVSKSEFRDALAKLQQARAWIRFCPDCIYANSCAYCMECNANCSDCTENAFCASCWADHPARHKVAEEDEDGIAAATRALDPVSQARTQLLIRPLNWAYTSPLMRWLPVTQKAALRQALRYHQQQVDAAMLAAEEEEKAAMQRLKQQR